MDMIATDDAPQPAGHYSQAVVHQGIVYVAGQLPLDPTDPNAPLGDARQQTRQALENVGSILEAAGSGLDRTLQMTVYLTDISLWPLVNEAYADVMGAHRPARAVVPVGALKPGCIIEIQAIASVREGTAESR